MTSAIGPEALAALTGGAWLLLGLLRIAHHRLERRDTIRQAEAITRAAARRTP